MKSPDDHINFETEIQRLGAPPPPKKKKKKKKDV